MTPIVQRLIANKHTSGAAAVYVGAKLLAGLGAIWLPDYQKQFDQTASLIESIAISYGLFMAGDGDNNGDTKPTNPNTP